jgi:CRP-like cAMP-binding protein
MTDPLAPLLEGLTGRQQDQARFVFEPVTVHHGTSLIVEGDEDASLLVVVDGELEVRTGDVELWTAGPGEILGEIGLFAGGVRTATVETNTETSLLILTRSGYEELVERGNPLAMILERRALDALVRRLRAIDARIAELAEGTDLADVTPTRGWFDRVRDLFGAGGQRRAPDLHVPSALAENRLFQGAGGAALDRVAPAFQAEAWGPGTVLCREGEVGDRMFLLVQGLVDVLIATREQRVEPVATLDAGDAFGMAGLVDMRPRSASCVARDEVVVLALDRPGWSRTIREDDAAGRALRLAVIRSLSEQLAYANGQLALLDLTAQAADLTPLLRATAGVEAPIHGLGG